MTIPLSAPEYRQQLGTAIAAEFSDVEIASNFSRGGSLRISGPKGLSVAVECSGSNGRPVAVVVRAGFRRGDKRRYTNLTIPHVVKQLRAFAALVAVEEAERAVRTAQYAARETREDAAIAPVKAVADRINEQAYSARHLSVEERPDGTGGYIYLFGVQLESLTEAQVLAVLAIVEGAVPPPGPWSFQGRRLGTPAQQALVDEYRAQVDALAAAEREAGDR